MAQYIICPHCQSQISIDDALTHQIQEKIKREFKIKLTADIKAELNQEKAQEMQLLADQLADKDRKLYEARQTELELRKAKIQLEEDKKAFEIEKQRQLDMERQNIIAEASKKASEEQHFKLMELTKQLNDAKEFNQELQRKLEQGSQQTQGEVMELELEEILKRRFPQDTIIPVNKGANGADIIQKVCDKYGHPCGSIVWESKHTKNWTEGWIQKLKDDQLREKADLAVIVSTALPKDHNGLDLRSGVWVTDFSSVVGLALALRSNLIQISGFKLSTVGKNEKMEVLYNYLIGSEFRQRIEAIVTAFTNMHTDLNQEKRAYTRIWEKREKQINRVIESTVGMYGDIEGISGQSLPKIDLMELPSEID